MNLAEFIDDALEGAARRAEAAGYAETSIGEDLASAFGASGFRVVKAEPESFVRKVNGRETIRIAEEIR